MVIADDGNYRTNSRSLGTGWQSIDRLEIHAGQLKRRLIVVLSTKSAGAAVRRKARSGRRARVELARFRVDTYRYGVHAYGGACSSNDPIELNGVHFFDSVLDAAANWLHISWEWESLPDVDSEIDRTTWNPTDIMLNEMALIVDRVSNRPVAVISHRPARSGESRRPVAMIVDLNTGVIAEQTIERIVGR